MNTGKLLIADASEEFTAVLTEALKNRCQVLVCSDGEDALRLLRSERPQVLITDTMLPGLDGITMLQTAFRENILPHVLAITTHRSAYILNALQQLGVSYVMCKPCKTSAVAERAMDLMTRSGSAALQGDLRSTVTQTLLALRMSPKQRGYDCTREALLCLLNDRRLSMTKELYPAVAERCSGNAKQVEKAIRDAITQAWKTRDPEVWPRYFRPCADGTIPKPTNAEFLARVVEGISLRSY